MTFDQWYIEKFGEPEAYSDQYQIAKQAWEAGYNKGYDDALEDYNIKH